MTYKNIPLPIKSNKQTRAYVKAALSLGVYVAPITTGWQILETDTENITKFETKPEAITAAEKALKNRKGTIFIFNKNCDLVKSYSPKI